MKRILLPLEETDRSLKAIGYVTGNFKPEEAEIVVMMVDETPENSIKKEAAEEAMAALNEKISMISERLEGFKVTPRSAVGKAGAAITKAARDLRADLIVMTKSSKDDMTSLIGSTSQYVLNNAPCDVVIVSETIHSKDEYRGLIYRTATAQVALWGLLTNKQSECLLPSVNVDCNYHFDVTAGRVRFLHTAYNPETRNWDRQPLPGQEFSCDIVAGDSVDILVKADATEGKADRIRIVNRDMRGEARFTYRITRAPKEQV